jgi:4-amino-4-deoxychorismate lyase
MSPFIETIQLRDGQLKNLTFHQARFDRTRTEVMGLKSHPPLHREIIIPGGLERGLFKCRVLYRKEIECIEYEPYLKREVNSLKMVRSDSISYNYKSTDRSALKALYGQRGSCDDILIIRKGFVTDSYYANVAIRDGDSWITPDTPLLPGTMRASLLEKGILREARITAADLASFEKLRLINALNPIEEAPEIHMDRITGI